MNILIDFSKTKTDLKIHLFFHSICLNDFFSRVRERVLFLMMNKLTTMSILYLTMKEQINNHVFLTTQTSWFEHIGQ